MSPDPAFIPNPAPLTLKSVASVLFRRKFLILTLFTSIAALVAALTALLPRQYESRMKVLVKNERADLVVSPDARNDAVLHADVSEAQVNSEIELLSSNDLLARVVRSCSLYEQHAAGTVNASGSPSPLAFELAVRKLAKDLKITPVRKANIIQVVYAASTPRLAAAVLEQLSAAYLDAHLSVHRTAGTTEFFSSQAAQYQSGLRDAENQLSAFRLAHNLTAAAQQESLLVQKFIDTGAALNEAAAALAESDTRVARLRLQIDALAPRIVTQSRVLPNQYSVERLNTMLAELENRRTQALAKFLPGDRAVTELDQEIANTRAALDRAAALSATEQATDVNPLRQSLEGDLARAELQSAGLQARRDALSVTLAAYRARLSELQSDSVQHDALQRSVKESEENYLLYSRKQEEARIADSLDRQKISNVAIAERPAEHHIPARPNVALNLLLGLFLAAFVSLGAAFAAEYAGSTFHTPSELEQSTGLPVLATVPYTR